MLTFDPVHFFIGGLIICCVLAVAAGWIYRRGWLDGYGAHKIGLPHMNEWEPWCWIIRKKPSNQDPS